MLTGAPRLTSSAQALPLLDPAHWQQAFLGRKLWQMQQDIARAVVSEPLVAVKGCHASGKTWMAAGLPLFYLLRYKNCRVFTTGPTQRQVKTFWREIFSAWTSGKVRNLLPEPQTMGLTVAPDRYAFGASSSSGVNVQGPHAENFLIIADEAPGIIPEVWDSIEGMRAGGNVHLLSLGNPVVPSGQFYDYFTRARSTTKCFSISAFDTPNLAGTFLDVRDQDGSWRTLGDRNGRPLLELTPDELSFSPYPALISRQWVRERYHVWGPNHPKFRSRVLAEFPQQSPYAVFDLAWIEAAARDATEIELAFARDRNACIQCGLDVAGPGCDETVLTARVNGMILGQWFWNDDDPRYSVLRQLASLRTHPHHRLGPVVVDIAGIGFHFATWLADQGIQVYGFLAGGTPIDQHQYANLKSEAYFEAREHFKRGMVSGLEDEETQAQLSTLQYRETDRGLTAIESKDDARKRGVPSPDRAESLIMAFFRIKPRQMHVEEQWHRVRISSI